jgi:hypothetical protein
MRFCCLRSEVTLNAASAENAVVAPESKLCQDACGPFPSCHLQKVLRAACNLLSATLRSTNRNQSFHTDGLVPVTTHSFGRKSPDILTM